MFDCSLGTLAGVFSDGFKDGCELFYDIHCSDPFTSLQDIYFPIVAVHSTGLYLVLRIDEWVHGSELVPEPDRLDYFCRVFKLKFSTTVPVRCLFLKRGGKNGDTEASLEIYDCGSRSLLGSSINQLQDIRSYLKTCIRSHRLSRHPLETGDVVRQLSRIGSSVLVDGSSDKYCLVRRGSEWELAFRKDSSRVYNLAVFGGFVGAHRFYVGSFGSGLLYALTFGLMGIGWVLDCLLILLGRWKCKDIWIMQLPKKRLQVMKFGAVVLGWVVLSIIFSRFA